MTLNEKLDKHLKAIKEDANLEQNIYKKAETRTLGKLVWALLRPTLTSNSSKFIAPSFNDIKAALIADIKDSVKDMQKEWDEPKETIVGYLLDPSKYDDEIGNYADTTFAEPVSDLLNTAELKSISHFENDLVNYLNKEIQRNYRQLIISV